MSDQSPYPSTFSSDAITRVAGPALFRAGNLLCNRFRVVRFIARGGMGELYEADDLTLGERVALKTVRPDIAGDVRAIQRFRREVQLARKVTHPGICRIFDLFEHVPSTPDEPGPPACTFVTMELLHGETVSERLSRNGPLTSTEALPIARQMAAALTAAHAAGVVHRDFKSNNVMLIDGGGSQPLRVVVTDFGLAHRVDEFGAAQGPALTLSGELMGTPDYMAPEQVEGKAPTPATDIYALGVVLYEMVTGRRPFAADTPLGAALLRVTGPPPKAPSQWNPDVPAAWDRAIMKCLSRHPEDRFPDAMTAVGALDETSPLPPAPGMVRRSRVPLIAGALLAVALLGVIVGGGATAWLNRARRPSDSVSATSADAARPAVAVLGFRNLAGRSDTQWLATALSEMLTTELGAAEHVRTVPGETVNRMKAELSLADAEAYNEDTLARIRKNVGADIIVSGSYVTVGEGDDATLRLDVRVQDARRGETLSLVSDSGRSAELLEIVSRTGTQLRSRLGFSPVADTTSLLRASLPGSPEAARFYAEGLSRLRSFDALGARTRLERAIELDPEFPLAYSALAATWSALGYDSRARDAASQAFRLSDDLPRSDRLQVEGTFHEMSNEWKEAIGIWQTLHTFFPDDVEYVLRLANAQIAGGAARDGLNTIEDFRQRFPAMPDPRLDLTAARAAETLSDFPQMRTAIAAAVAAAEAQGATLLVASARLTEGSALLQAGQTEAATAAMEQARAIYEQAGDLAGVARALNGLAITMSNGPDTARTRALYEEGLAIARKIGKQDLVARLLNNIAIEERRAGNLRASLAMNEESLAIRREIGDRTNAAVSLNNIGNVLLDLADLEKASRYYQESADLSREVGDRRSTARALYNAGVALSQLGELARARNTYEESLAIRRAIDDPAGIATSLHGLGELALLEGDLAGATRSLEDALAMDRRLGRRRPIAYSLFQLGEVSYVKGDLAAARQRHEEALEMRVADHEQVTEAESHVALAWLDVEEGHAAAAESQARSAASVLAAQSATTSEALARATLALALLAQGKQDPATREVSRAQALVQPQQVVLRLFTAIAAARVEAASEPDASLRALEGVRAEAVRRRLARLEFEARRASVGIEGQRSGDAGRQRLAALRKDAAAKGFGLFAR